MQLWSLLSNAMITWTKKSRVNSMYLLWVVVHRYKGGTGRNLFKSHSLARHSVFRENQSRSGSWRSLERESPQHRDHVWGLSWQLPPSVHTEALMGSAYPCVGVRGTFYVYTGCKFQNSSEGLSLHFYMCPLAFCLGQKLLPWSEGEHKTEGELRKLNCLHEISALK